MYRYTLLKPQTPNRELTAAARAALRGHWGGAVGVMIITVCFAVIIPIILKIAEILLKRSFSGPHLLALLIGFTVAAGIVSFFVQIFVNLAMPHYFLSLFDRGNADVGKSCKCALRRYATCLWAMALIWIIVVLKLLLFIVPGILAVYDYSMAVFCLLDDPELRPGEALKRSRAIMHGHRWQFFCFGWRFFGWFLLSLLSCGIGFLWFAPYVQTGIVAFYRSVMPGKEEALYLELPDVKHRPYSAAVNGFWLVTMLLLTLLGHSVGTVCEFFSPAQNQDGVKMVSAPVLPEE